MTTHHVLLHVEEQSNDKVYNLPIHRWLDILWYNHCKGFVGCNVQNKRSFAEKKHLKKKTYPPQNQQFAGPTAYRHEQARHVKGQPYLHFQDWPFQCFGKHQKPAIPIRFF